MTDYKQKGDILQERHDRSESFFKDLKELCGKHNIKVVLGDITDNATDEPFCVGGYADPDEYSHTVLEYTKLTCTPGYNFSPDELWAFQILEEGLDTPQPPLVIKEEDPLPITLSLSTQDAKELKNEIDEFLLERELGDKIKKDLIIGYLK